jgi:hypothetical protein
MDAFWLNRARLPGIARQSDALQRAISINFANKIFVGHNPADSNTMLPKAGMKSRGNGIKNREIAD